MNDLFEKCKYNGSINLICYNDKKLKQVLKNNTTFNVI